MCVCVCVCAPWLYSSIGTDCSSRVNHGTDESSSGVGTTVAAERPSGWVRCTLWCDQRWPKADRLQSLRRQRGQDAGRSLVIAVSPLHIHTVSGQSSCADRFRQGQPPRQFFDTSAGHDWSRKWGWGPAMSTVLVVVGVGAHLCADYWMKWTDWLWEYNKGNEKQNCNFMKTWILNGIQAHSSAE